MTGDIILTSITKSELEEIISNSLKKLIPGSTKMEDLKDEVMNQKQASEYLGISQSTIIQWKKRGLISYEQLEGSSKIRFYKSQLKLILVKNPGLLQAARK